MRIGQGSVPAKIIGAAPRKHLQVPGEKWVEQTKIEIPAPGLTFEPAVLGDSETSLLCSLQSNGCSDPGMVVLIIQPQILKL